MIDGTIIFFEFAHRAKKYLSTCQASCVWIDEILSVFAELKVLEEMQGFVESLIKKYRTSINHTLKFSKIVKKNHIKIFNGLKEIRANNG